MATNDYVFVTHWRVPGTVAEVYDVLIEGTQYPRWWPQVYLEVVETDVGGKHGLGKKGRLLTKGKLPYRLRWDMNVVEAHYPNGFTLEASGDFVGRGVDGRPVQPHTNRPLPKLHLIARTAGTIRT